MGVDLNEISAVICVKNGAKTLNDCLISIEKNQPGEIIIIDDGSTDNTLDIARRYTKKIYSNDGKGLAYARQWGAEKATGKYIFYMDADAELTSHDTLSKMLEELKRNSWIAIQSFIISPNKNQTYWERGENFFWEFRINKSGEKSILSTGNCLIYKDIVLKFKFDPYFQGATEDTDFFVRLYMAGYKFGTSPEIVFHHHKSSFQSFIKQKIWYGKGHARLFWKYHNLRILFAPLSLIIEPGWFCIRFKKPELIFYFVLWSVGYSIGFISEISKLIRQKNFQ